MEATEAFLPLRSAILAARRSSEVTSGREAAMRVMVTGATGFVGKQLCRRLLREGHAVTALSRDAARASSVLGSEVTCLSWGGADDRKWRNALGSVEGIVHLAGESVAAERWTPEYKRKIYDSRIQTTRTLVDAMRTDAAGGSAIICASAVGFYGDRADETLTESSPPGTGFLPETCVAWEAEALRAEEDDHRVALLRIGIVLGAGGALEKMLYPLPLPISPIKLGLGGPLGNGRQWLPWIHLDDAVGLFLHALVSPISGPLNVTSPNPVTNAEFTRTLGHLLHRPAIAPVPGFVLRALVGEFADTLLGGQRVLPTVAQKTGYRFQHETLESALASLLKTLQRV